ncbi:hypothetical protein BX611_1360 [Lutibacter oceani]|uniref:Uncharacterized protein n=1 Tax=Lutibacter oceani TaxID=1853311 RepID=A0A3D9RVN7_9FLAO|nr:hypothetical protein [Lutibacter oceani]REE81821.1 hypothetical protein BX611_1360 [Lutibacter oceani]
MKKLKITILLAAMLMVIPLTANAQEESTTQAYVFHTDPVYPSKLTDYEIVAKKLSDECKKYKTKAGWATFKMNGTNYVYVSPLKNMAELDENNFSDLQEKMGKDAFRSLFNEFNPYYDSHSDYVMILDKELSYMPSGINITPEGLNYRHNTLYYFTPNNYNKAVQIAKEFKKLYADKGSKEYYRVYHSGFGTSGNYIMVARASKNAAEFEKSRIENNNLIGEDGGKLFQKLLGVLLKSETMTGYMIPELSYFPN